MKRFELVVIGVVGCAMLVGCAESTPVSQEEFFAAEDKPNNLTVMLERQTDRGAAADATLYPIHFDGPALNALGRTKLAALANEPALAEHTIYVGSPSALASARQQAVGAALQELGFASASFRVQAGADPRSLHPAAGELLRLPKTESGVAGGAPSTGGAGAGSAQPDAPPAGAANPSASLKN